MISKEEQLNQFLKAETDELAWAQLIKDGGHEVKVFSSDFLLQDFKFTERIETIEKIKMSKVSIADYKGMILASSIVPTINRHSELLKLKKAANYLTSYYKSRINK